MMSSIAVNSRISVSARTGGEAVLLLPAKIIAGLAI